VRSQGKGCQVAARGYQAIGAPLLTVCKALAALARTGALGTCTSSRDTCTLRARHGRAARDRGILTRGVVHPLRPASPTNLAMVGRLSVTAAGSTPSEAPFPAQRSRLASDAAHTDAHAASPDDHRRPALARVTRVSRGTTLEPRAGRQHGSCLFRRRCRRCISRLQRSVRPGGRVACGPGAGDGDRDAAACASVDTDSRNRVARSIRSSSAPAFDLGESARRF
jgi:hypothetical protein